MYLLSSVTVSTSSAIALLVTVALAAWTDLTSWRIPNQLIAGSAAAALMLAGFAVDGIGFSKCLQGGVIGFSVFMPLYFVKGMAAGDVKLMSVIGMYVGPLLVIDIALLVCLIGGAWALVVMAVKKETGLLPWMLLQWRSRTGKWVNPKKEWNAPEKSSGQMIPYGVVIALGTVAAML